MLNEDLFSPSINEPEVIRLENAEFRLYRQFFNQMDSDKYYKQLLQEIAWQQGRIKLYGKLINEPRLSAWYGDKNKSYTYSGVTREAINWTPALLDIKHEVELVTNHMFNSVLANLYRNEKDSVSWHSDDEPELGKNPVIASVSFGEPRVFQLRNKSNIKDKYSLELTHGSLLLMCGATQHNWQHQVAKEPTQMGVRINLTFRQIMSST